MTKKLAHEGWKAALELAKEKGCAPLLAETFTVTGEMLARRPEMVTDGFKVGDSIKGSVLHAKYSRYMQRIAQIDPELVNQLADIGARYTHGSSLAPTGTTALSLGNNACIAKGTMIHTDMGYYPIEDVTTNMRVQGFDVDTQTWVFRDVLFSGVTRRDTTVYEVELENGMRVKATDDHQFLVYTGTEYRYHTVSDLAAYLKWKVKSNGLLPKSVWCIVDSSTTKVNIRSITPLDETIDTYDITVDTDNDLNRNFVANGVVVHNSNGIEPSFAHHYSRNVIVPGKATKEKMDVFSYELLAYRHHVDPDAMPYVEGKPLPDYFVSADTISPRQHVDVQAAAQKWIDGSISKTINIPTDYPYEDFKSIYEYAYDMGLKGATTFRFNPEAFQGVLVKEQDLENTLYEFSLEDGTTVQYKGNETVEYGGETHTVANLFDALKEGTYGKW